VTIFIECLALAQASGIFNGFSETISAHGDSKVNPQTDPRSIIGTMQKVKNYSLSIEKHFQARALDIVILSTRSLRLWVDIRHGNTRFFPDNVETGFSRRGDDA